MRAFELSEEQISMLRHIYQKRFKLLVAVFSSLPFAIGGTLFNILDNENKVNTYIGTITFLLCTIAVVVLLIYLYFYKVIPVKKDIVQKSGKYDDKVIINKSVFEQVNQYYLFFEDVKMSNKEIRPEEFARFHIGDTFPVPMGKYSNLVLDGFMNYELF